MSSIAGFFQPNTTYAKDNAFCSKTIRQMSQSLIHRGPDKQSFYYFPQGAFSYNFLLAGYIPGTYPQRLQPTSMVMDENTYTLFFDGFITNADEIAKLVCQAGFSTNGYSLEDLLLRYFFLKGTDFIKDLRGAFALCIYDEGYKTLYLFRDPLGLRPLFYSFQNETLVFASEIKALFCYPGIRPVLDRDGLTELLSLGPARIPGNAIFSGISEVKPGHFVTFNKNLFLEEAYHQFKIKEHTDSYADTLDHIQTLLDQSIRSLKDSVMPPCSFLSGGLDSSIITAKLAKYKKRPLATYSFEFENGKQHFKANAFQPALDAPFVQEMVSFLGTEHSSFTCNSQTQLDYLKKSVLAHDLPTMADIDASYLYFCERVSDHHKIVFTGECADEIFCGYPWYHIEHKSSGFPWSEDLSPRRYLLNDNLISRLPFEECVTNAYQNACKDINLSPGNICPSQQHQRTFYLTIRYFMQTLINRNDRATASCGMDARVPFASQDLTEYLFNVPLEMQTKDGYRKHLLREYAANLLPESVRLRQKSPYPKTYDPEYETLVSRALLHELSNPNCPLLEFVDRNKVDNYCRQSKDLGRPWFGQLMAGPQLSAFYLQILYWLKSYQIDIKL